MRASRHAVDMCVCLSLVVATMGAGDFSLPTPSCSIETAGGVSLQCSSSYTYKEGKFLRPNNSPLYDACELPERNSTGRTNFSSSSSSSSAGREEVEEEEEEEEEDEEEEEEVTVRERVFGSGSSLVDINFPLWHTSQAAVVVTGVSRRPQRRRCVVMIVSATVPGAVTLRDLALLHGSYQVMVLKKRREPGGGGGGAAAAARGRREVLKVKQTHFVLPERRRQPSHGHLLSRQRRNREPAARTYDGTSSTRDLILQDLGQDQDQEEEEAAAGGLEGSHTISGSARRGGGGCQCCKCFSFNLNYEERKARLTFNYTLNASCDAECSALNVQLYRDGLSHSARECEEVKQDEKLLLRAERVGLDKNVTEGPIQYSNVGAGCYFVELKPHVYRMPERTLLFWVTPAINITDMDAWDPVFNLEPNPEGRSLTVRWKVEERYNFTKYELSLQHHPSLRIICTGRAIYHNMTIIPPFRPLTVKQPQHLFHNLSTGWYCARVTPKDDRCPLDGCHVMSSPPVLLKEPVEWSCKEGEGESTGCEEMGVLGLTLLVVGCVLGAVVTGVAVAWGLLHTWPSLSRVFSSSTYYSPVPVRAAAKANSGCRQVVLLVWTLQGPHGAKFGPIVAAFKTILRTYSCCEVYDYLELSSLPEREQLHLLASPTTWLDSILAQRSIKVMIIATEGAWQRQVEWQQLLPGPYTAAHQHSPPPAPYHAHDQLLFPYLLRRLHDQPDLAGDYSRVFHVRFSEVSHSAVELGNVVSWKRYKIPEHLWSLTVALHGGLGAATFEEPSEDQLRELRAALSSHPQYRSHLSNGTGPLWPSPVANGCAKMPDVASSCTNLVDSSHPAAAENGSVKTSENT